MALSTSIPTPSASPPNETMLSVKPLKYINANVVMTEIGMAMPMMSVLVMLRRKNSSTTTASPPPTSVACSTFRMAPRIKSAESHGAASATLG